MTLRIVAACLLLSTSVAAADEIVLAPSCAAIDETRDTLAPEQRIAALALLTRALEEADLYVVPEGCVDHYVLSHEQDPDGQPMLRLVGPQSAIRLRHVPHEPDPDAYMQLVAAVIRAAEPAAEPEPAPELAPAPEPEAVSTASETPNDLDADSTEPTSPGYTHSLYGQLLAGSQGTGAMVGYRHQFEANVLDLAVGALGDRGYGVELAHARVLHLSSPAGTHTVYAGAGLGWAHEADFMNDASGPRIEGVVGLELAREKTMPVFFEAEVAVPMYQFDGGYSPTFALSVGLSLF